MLGLEPSPFEAIWRSIGLAMLMLLGLACLAGCVIALGEDVSAMLLDQ